MIIQLMSDLHSEFYKHFKFKKFVKSLESKNVDCLLLAGDIGDSKKMPDAIKWLCDHYKNVIHILGNHEYWGSSPEKVIEGRRDFASKTSNYHFLNNDVLEIGKHRFLGTTLWFEKSPISLTLKNSWPDFRKIDTFTHWIFDENQRATNFLHKEMKENDIVVTHHLPSEKCVAPEYEGDRTNCFYFSPMDTLIQERNPRLWCFGHTHNSIHKQIGKTTMLCNPYGYKDYEENHKFNPSMMVEL